MDNGTRDELHSRLAEAVGSLTIAHPTRVAIDGPPAAGKTTLGDELAVVLRSQGREVIRVSIESFLLPRAQRYRRGEYSAEGCYHDSFDLDALHRVLLDPLGPGGDRRFRHAVYDRPTENALSLPVMTAPADAVLLFDGVFLLRPELIDRWDLRIFVSAAFRRHWIAPGPETWRCSDPPPKSSDGTASATDPPNSSTSAQSARLITPTSSCTTTIHSSRHGSPEYSDQILRVRRFLIY